MNSKFKKIFILILPFFFISVFAFDPIKNYSGSNKCYYKIDGKKSDNVNYTKDWAEISCNTDVDFGTLNIPDGEYNLYLKGEDQTSEGDNKTFTDGASPSKTNKFGIRKSPETYKIDTTKPTCLLKEIKFIAGESNNQYYNSGSLYYNSNAGSSGKFELIIESDDTNNGANPNVSKINKVDFPTILGANPNTSSFTNSGKILTTGKYEWSGSHNDTFDILNSTGTQVCYDNAGNSSPLVADLTTKITFEDNKTITGITSLILTPDSSIPTVDGVAYNSMGNGFKFASGNDGSGTGISIYDGDTNTSKYFSALHNRKIIIPKFSDEGSGLKSFKVNIENYNNYNSQDTYFITGSTYNNKLTDLINNNIAHNFSLVDFDYTSNSGYRQYDWNVNTVNLAGNSVKNDEICDMVGNCVNIPAPDFRVVANSPDSTITTHNLNSTYTGSISNMSDEYSTVVLFKDKYGNSIVPVFGVKKLTLDINFDNTLGCDQLSNTGAGDCVDFSFINKKPTTDSTLNGSTNPDAGEKHNFNYVLSQYSHFGGNLGIELKSGVPTKNEYITYDNKPLYGSNTAILQLKNLNIKVDYVTSYSGIGENSSALEVATNGNQPSYKWNPIINFNKIGDIYPLVEGQEKELKDLTNVVKDTSRLYGYNLETKFGTNNFFLQFKDSQLRDGNLNKGNENYDILLNYIQYNTGSGKGNMSYNDIDLLKFIPKTIGGIESNNKNVAMYSNLHYKVGSLPVLLPGIQTGFDSYGPHQTGDFDDDNKYFSNSNIALAEVDIRGTTQSKNNVLSGTGASSSDGSFKDYSSIKLLDIKTDINKNVVKLLAGVDRSKGTQGSKTITSFDFSNQGGLKLQNNQIIYFKNTDVIISCAYNLCSVSGKKTIIVENGNLTIKSDMKYTNNNSVLGIILIGNKDGSKSQLRISEDITNGVGIVYSEGPIVSVNSAGEIYNGSNTTNTNLVNQLYWKGSFASRNTVGGAIKDGNGVCPYGTSDYKKSSCTIETAQGYDLIYLRRYARVGKDYYSTITGDPMGDGNIPINIDKIAVKTAGGDKYNISSGSKISGNLPKPGNYSTSDKAKNSPLILEYDTSLKSNPPFGFNN